MTESKGVRAADDLMRWLMKVHGGDQGMVVGRRLTYRVLCAIDDAGFMGIK